MDITIPVQHQKRLSLYDAIITCGLDGCLTLFSEEEWEGVIYRFDNLCSSKKASRHLIRFINLMKQGAVKTKIRKGGKITIPDYLKQYAKIKKEMLFIELSNHLEIWAEEEFEKYRDRRHLEKIVSSRVG